MFRMTECFHLIGPKGENFRNMFLFANAIMQTGILGVKYGLSSFLCTISLGQNEANSRRDAICYASALSLYFSHRDIL